MTTCWAARTTTRWTGPRKVLAVAPDQRRLARANRAFAIRAVRMLADAGIRQFIDLGTGFPTSPSVHEAARQADPSARVVYVDHDPDAMGELRAVAAGTPVETYFRPRHRIRRFFGGFELLPPGLTDVQAWRQDATAPTRLRIAGAVGRKP